MAKKTKLEFHPLAVYDTINESIPVAEQFNKETGYQVPGTFGRPETKDDMNGKFKLALRQFLRRTIEENPEHKERYLHFLAENKRIEQLRHDNRLKKNPADDYECIDIKLTKEKTPIAYARKVKELVGQGMTVEDAEKFIDETPFEMEFYYSIDRGLFLVEAEAVEATTIYDPYTGKEMEENDD